MRNILTVILLLSSGVVSAQLTPVTNIGGRTTTVNVPPKYAGSFQSGRTLEVDSNYTVSVFHIGGMSKPRFMAFSPSGVLHVSDQNAGRVFALPDVNNDGVADTILEAASGFSGNHDVKFYKGDMYVTEPTRIWKYTDGNGDGVYETRTVFISGIANNPFGHTTRTVVFDSVNQKAYVSVGSSCNVCRETNQAIIEQYNDDGTGRRIFSTGTRNAVGMALHPVTNQLWANNNGSDGQGNEIPPEWIDIVRDGGFYGHPFAYGSGSWFNFGVADYSALLPITATDSANVARMVQPAALIRAHSAPMAIAFLNSNFGASKQHGFLTALRGSWNSPNSFRGYKVIYGHLSSAQDTSVDYVADFCTGFLTDTVNRVFWGRPVGIAIGNDGKVYVSSDETNRCILVFTPKPSTGISGVNKSAEPGAIYPNPATEQFTLPLKLPTAMKVSVRLYDISGKEVITFMDQVLPQGNHNQTFDVEGITPGTYLLKVTMGNNESTQRLIVNK
jgi:glucose/arabinose dehydrogenase